jgi:uncharacterized protein (DUF697 family)
MNKGNQAIATNQDGAAADAAQGWRPTLVLSSLLQRPLLAGGLGLSATLALLGSAHFNPLDSSTLLSAIALGSGVWWWRRDNRAPVTPKPIAPPVVDRSRVEAELAALAARVATLAQESDLATASPMASETLEIYQQQHQALVAELDRQTLRVAIAGDPRTGKTTTLLTLLTPDSSLVLQEESLAANAPPDWLSYDGVLLLTDGDITDSALTLLRDRLIAGQGAVLVFNKRDHYDTADQQTILTQLQRQVATLPAPVSVVATAAAPRPIKVRRHQTDGTVSETLETPPAEIDGLSVAIDSALVARRSTLVEATVLRRTQALGQQVQTDLNRLRRDRALPQIDQLQWVAGAAAFANPVPTLDLLATVAINGQLIMDLGQIYGFNLSLDEAKTAAGTLARLTVKLGLVELSTQVLTAVLKGHFATYIAGGLVQGLSAAYLTRMAGLSLVDYFEQAALAGTPTAELSWDAIAQRLQSTVQQNRQLSLLKTLARQGIDILKPAQLPASSAPALDLDAAPSSTAPVTVEAVPADTSAVELDRS